MSWEYGHRVYIADDPDNLWADDKPMCGVQWGGSDCLIVSREKSGEGREFEHGFDNASAAVATVTALVTCDAFEQFATALNDARRGVATQNRSVVPIDTPGPGYVAPVPAPAAPWQQPQDSQAPPPASNSNVDCVPRCDAQTQACYARSSGKMSSCKADCQHRLPNWRGLCVRTCTDVSNQEALNCQMDEGICHAHCP
jgi:hypothetical protein